MSATSRAEFRAFVRQTAECAGLAECAVVAALAARVTRKASLAADPAEVAYLDQIAAAMNAEIGPALDRDARRGR